jgi:3',5'-cyclic AMP phosphodiesterase CpdA
MKKIIHLSDLHLGALGRADLLTGMIDRLIYLYQPAGDFVVVITGDLVDNAARPTQLAAAVPVLGRIRDAGYPLVIVPGNHDYGSGNRARTSLVSRYKFLVYGDADYAFPSFQRIGDIGFIGLDSMEGEIRKKQGLLADGELGAEQLGRLDRLLDSPELRDCPYRVVCLHHHPLDPGGFLRTMVHGLDDAEDLKRVLGKHPIDALLFGHNHDGKPWNGNWGIPRAYDAGSSTGHRGPQGPHRVIDLSQPPYTDFDARL